VSFPQRQEFIFNKVTDTNLKQFKT